VTRAGSRCGRGENRRVLGKAARGVDTGSLDGVIGVDLTACWVHVHDTRKVRREVTENLGARVQMYRGRKLSDHGAAPVLGAAEHGLVPFACTCIEEASACHCLERGGLELICVFGQLRDQEDIRDSTDSAQGIDRARNQLHAPFAKLEECAHSR